MGWLVVYNVWWVFLGQLILTSSLVFAMIWSLKFHKGTGWIAVWGLYFWFSFYLLVLLFLDGVNVISRMTYLRLIDPMLFALRISQALVPIQYCRRTYQIRKATKALRSEIESQ